MLWRRVRSRSTRHSVDWFDLIKWPQPVALSLMPATAVVNSGSFTNCTRATIELDERDGAELSVFLHLCRRVFTIQWRCPCIDHWRDKGLTADLSHSLQTSRVRQQQETEKVVTVTSHSYYCPACFLNIAVCIYIILIHTAPHVTGTSFTGGTPCNTVPSVPGYSSSANTRLVWSSVGR